MIFLTWNSITIPDRLTVYPQRNGVQDRLCLLGRLYERWIDYSLGMPIRRNAADFFGGKCLQILLVKYLGGDFKDFLFSPLPGEMIQFD